MAIDAYEKLLDQVFLGMPRVSLKSDVVSRVYKRAVSIPVPLIADDTPLRLALHLTAAIDELTYFYQPTRNNYQIWLGLPYTGCITRGPLEGRLHVGTDSSRPYLFIASYTRDRHYGTVILLPTTQFIIKLRNKTKRRELYEHPQFHTDHSVDTTTAIEESPSVEEIALPFLRTDRRDRNIRI